MLGENKLLKNRYLINKKREETGFGTVFLATDLYSNKQVLVQVLASYLIQDENFATRFERTAKSIAGSIHPNILGVFDYGPVEDTLYVVIPLIEGETLKDKLKREKKLSLPQVNRYLQQVAAAIDFANAHNILYFGVTPPDILLQAENDWLLIVFDIEQVFRGTETHSRVMPSPSYLAPEQLSGKMEATSHIYTLGCILFQMLTGQPPYNGPVVDLIVGHKVGPIPSIVERSQGQLPEDLQPVIEKALAKEPKARFQTANELATAFQKVLLI